MKNYKKMMGLALTSVLSLSLLTACGDKKADPTRWRTPLPWRPR